MGFIRVTPINNKLTSEDKIKLNSIIPERIQLIPINNIVDVNMGIKKFNYINVTSNLTITASNLPLPGSSATTIVDLYNAGNYTLTFASYFEFAGDVDPTFSPNAWDRLVFISIDGTHIWVHIAGQNFII